MDALQHINKIADFRYFETASIVHFEQVDNMRDGIETHTGPIHASTDCR